MAHHDAISLDSGKRRRDVWPDAAKGVCITLVVLLHLVSKHYAALEWDIPAPVTAGWKGVSSVLEPIRMPLFFAISGYFSASYLTRPWRDVAKKRLIPVYLLYILWLIIHSVFFALVSSPLSTEAHGWGGLVLAFVLGYTSLWYLYALPVYLVVARVCARGPRVSLALVSVMSLLSTNPLLPEIGNTPSLLRNFVYFLGGSLLTRYVARMAQQRVTFRVGALTALFVVASVAHAVGRYTTRPGAFTLDLGLAALQMMASVAGLIVGVILISAFARAMPKMSTGLAWLGQRTLPIYVLHLPLLALMSILLDGTSLPMPLVMIYPAFATVALVFVCVGASSVITAVGGGWLFDLKAIGRKRRSDALPHLTRV